MPEFERKQLELSFQKASSSILYDNFFFFHIFVWKAKLGVQMPEFERQKRPR
jgi:hypothetical protein